MNFSVTDYSYDSLDRATDVRYPAEYGNGDALFTITNTTGIATLPHKGTVNSLSFSVDNAVIATASDNEKWANVWRVATGEKLAELPGAGPPVVFSPIDRMLATGSRGEEVLLWDMTFR